MPSGPHDALVDLFRNEPSAALALAKDVLGIDLPAAEDVVVQDATFLEARPDYHADLVVLLRLRRSREMTRVCSPELTHRQGRADGFSGVRAHDRVG